MSDPWLVLLAKGANRVREITMECLDELRAKCAADGRHLTMTDIHHVGRSLGIPSRLLIEGPLSLFEDGTSGDAHGSTHAEEVVSRNGPLPL